MTISARLGLSFAVVILAGLAMALFGRAELQAANAQISVLANDRMAKVIDVADIINNMNVVARTGRDLLLVNDDADIKQLQKRLAATQSANAELLQKLDSQFISADEGRRLMDKIMAARKANRTAVDSAVKLALAGQGDEARAAFVKVSRPLQETYFDALADLMKWQREAALLGEIVAAN
jgi:methyl-accepting chemotaxis protein